MKSGFAKWNRLSRNEIRKHETTKFQIWIPNWFSWNEIAKNEIFSREIAFHEKKPGFREMKLAFAKNNAFSRNEIAEIEIRFAFSRNEIAFRENQKRENGKRHKQNANLLIFFVPVLY